VQLRAGGADDVAAVNAYSRWLRSQPPGATRSYRILPGLTHDAPMRADAATQRTFWSELDALVGRYA
jgi:hypothetical protein